MVNSAEWWLYCSLVRNLRSICMSKEGADLHLQAVLKIYEAVDQVDLDERGPTECPLSYALT